MDPSHTSDTDHAGRLQHDRSRHAQVIPPALARLPIHFFAVGVLSLGCAGLAAVVAMPDAVQFFYRPAVMAFVHTLTLGVITSVMMGVMYRYIPALVGRPVSFPRLPFPQLILFVAGAMGMIGHFAIGNWVGLWWSASVVLASVVLFALCLMPILWSQIGKGVAETGMFLAICYLLCAAVLGLLMGIQQASGLAWGNIQQMLSAHIVFAAVGWVTLTICAASYRFIPAFVLPAIELPAAALWQIYALALSVMGLALSLLFGLDGARLWSAAVAASLLAYLIILRSLIGSRRMKIDWAPRHAIAGAAWLVVTIVLGAVVGRTGGWLFKGERFAGALGAAAALGFIINFIIGMSYQLFPGFVGRVRTAFGWPAVTIAELSVAWTRPVVFALYNCGVALVVAAFLVESPDVALYGAVFLAGGTLLYAATMIWALSFAYRSSLPASARSPLRIIG